MVVLAASVVLIPRFTAFIVPPAHERLKPGVAVNWLLTPPPRMVPPLLRIKPVRPTLVRLTALPSRFNVPLT